MRVRVNLPPGALIECLGLCLSIARALCAPTDERELVGIHCIHGKWLPPFGERRPADPAESEAGLGTPPILKSDGEHRPNRSRADDVVGSDCDAVQSPLTLSAYKRYVEASSRWRPLDTDDRRVLEKLLPQLPELHYPMSEHAVTAFTEAYLRLRDRPRWMPDLVTAWAIEQRKAEQRECVVDHMRLLLQEFEEGRVVVVNEQHVRASTVCAGLYIPRAQAIAHLERHGFEYRKPEVDEDYCGTESTKPEKRLDQSNSGWRPGEPKLGPQERQELVIYHNELKAAGQKAFVKLTAEKFDLTNRSVYKIVREDKKARGEERIDQRLAGKPR